MQQPNELLPSFSPKTFTEMMQFCETISNSNFCPKDYKGKSGEIIVAIQYGAEIGLKPMQALQNIAVINGRPCVWGDSLLALVQASGLMEYIQETDDGKTATCIVKRKNYPNPHTVKFSTDDARQAGLAGKQGPWMQYPTRMRQMRARSFALRNQFADVLGGLIAREEAIDITPMPANGQLTNGLGPRTEEDIKHDLKTVLDDVEIVADRVPDGPEASSAEKGEQTAGSPAGGDVVTGAELKMVKALLAAAPGTNAEKTARIKKVLPYYVGAETLKQSDIEIFTSALQAEE